MNKIHKHLKIIITISMHNYLIMRLFVRSMAFLYAWHAPSPPKQQKALKWQIPPIKQGV